MKCMNEFHFGDFDSESIGFCFGFFCSFLLILVLFLYKKKVQQH